MERKLNGGPFKGQRLNEIPMTELDQYLRSEEATWDKNLKWLELVQEEWQRRSTRNV